MKSDNQRPEETKQDPEFIAQQLRRPSGDFATEVGQKMNQVNKPLYDLTFEVLELQENDHILEIGFGNGKFFKDLFSIKNKIQVKAIDFSEAMVEAAREENQEALSSGILDIKLGSSEAIPFPDQLFDKVFCNMVIYFWDQPEKHLKEVRRVLKPDGTFYTGIRTRESMRVFPFIEYGFNLYSMKEWEEILNQNGFLFKERYNRMDPEIEVQDNKIRLESCCIVAKKEAGTL